MAYERFGSQNFGHLDPNQKFDLYASEQCALGVRVMKLMGIENLIVTNAAGALNPVYKVGDFMMLKDHLNLQVRFMIRE